MNRRQGGISLIELMAVMAIIGVLMALGVPEFQRYLLRAKAAGVVIEAQPIIRVIQEYQSAIDKKQNRLELSNGTDGSISGCSAPVDSTCAAAGATPVVIVRPELLLITGGVIRVSAAPCYVDCPGFALNFSSDVNPVLGAQSAPAAPTSPAVPTEPATPATPITPATPTEPAAPATPVTPAAPIDPVPVEPEKGKGKGKGKGQQSELEGWPLQRVLSLLSMPLVPSAHAAVAAGDGGFTKINLVLYEFGELMRGKVHAADNAVCLHSTGTCTVTIKY